MHQKEELQRLVEQYKKYMQIYRTAKDYNEQNCRDEFISPFLECLGWDVHNKNGVLPQYREVVVERFSNKKERPDYTLTLNGVSKVFVEAKKPAVDIASDPAPAIQTRSYGWNAHHKIAVLTNFEYLLIFDTTNQPREGDTAETSLYQKYSYLEYIDKFEEITKLIGRESIYSGRFDEFTEGRFQDSERYTKEIDGVFLEQLNQWRLKIGRYLYNTSSEYKDIDVLNDAVQEFINQIIFLRICEDRNLPLYRKLKDAAADKKELKAVLTQMFKEADKRYNSKLFFGKNIIFDLDNEIIFHIIRSLYYPQTPYLFQIIEPGILGKIYESFLTEYLIEKDGEIELAAKKEFRYRSVVSTPIEIVKYMVKNVLEPYCEGKRPEEIKKLRIADISCGSGIFLEEAYQFLIDYCVGWYQANAPENLIELSNGKKKLTLADKKDILINCIYGVDIDVHAADVCRFSLLIKLMEDETPASIFAYIPVLPDLSTSVMCGNSLIGPKDIEGERLEVSELRRINPFDWRQINEGEGFDVIIGNPPYVKTEDIHSLELSEEFSIYKRKFKSAYKQFDKYFLFIEQALSLLRPQGELCYIVPNKFYKIDAGRELRRILLNKIYQLDDFGDMQLFPEKTIYSCILFCKNAGSAKVCYRSITSLTSLWTGGEQPHIVMEKEGLGNDTWRLSTDIGFMKMIAQLEARSAALSDVADIFNGIQTSAERPSPVYWFGKEEVLHETKDMVTITKFDRTFCIEKKLLKPYFKPTKADEKGMGTYSLLKTDKRIIFPYTEQGDLIPIDIMKKVYPGTYEYLLSCYDLLVPRCLNNGKGRDIKNAAPETWYQYGRSQALTAFIHTPKLIVRVLSKVPMYAYDEEDMLIASGGTAGYCAIAAKEGSNYDLAYIQAWLNHPYTEKLLRTMGSDFEGGFTARGTYLLKKIPFLELDFSDKRQKTAYELVVSWTRRIYALNKELENKKDKITVEVVEREIEKLKKQIEDKIGKIYRFEF